MGQRESLPLLSDRLNTITLQRCYCWLCTPSVANRSCDRCCGRGEEQ